jgi:2-keto-4-pentenoate hydratase
MPNLLDTLWQLQQQPDSDPSALFDQPDISADEGQALQFQLLERWLNEGEELGGWKIGMTSGESRDALGFGVRPSGFVLKSRIFRSGAQIPRASLYKGGVENELCFTVGSALGDGATADAAQAAIAGMAAGFEINQKRLPPNSPAGLRIADNLSNWGIVYGEPVTQNQLSDDLSHLNVTLSELTNGQTRTIEQVASEGHMDPHYQSLAILAQRLADFGHTLQPGQYVITGAYGKTPFEVGRFAGDFSLGIGRAELELTGR